MKRNPLLVFLAFALLLAGCLPANPAAQSADAPGIETIVAATYAAISAQTEAAKPLSSPTPVSTATPTKTPIPPTITPTFTPTFVIYTSTPMPTFTPIATSTPAVTATSGLFSCALVSQKPANGTTMGARNSFDWIWKVSNTGTKEWLAADVKYFYVSGDKFHDVESRGIPNNVRPGREVELGVDMIAPKNPGSYSTTWAMRRGSQVFCYITLNIIVQ